MAASTGSTARKGKAVEHLIAATCILASDGRLNVMTGMVDDEGIDLAFKATGGLRTVDIQVKVRFLSSKRLSRGEKFLSDVREATFQPRPDLYMLFTVVDGRAATFGPVRLVPSEVFEAEASRGEAKGKGRLRFLASLKGGFGGQVDALPDEARAAGAGHPQGAEQARRPSVDP